MTVRRVESESRPVVRLVTETKVVQVPASGRGLPGPSAYELAVANGFTGTLPEWLDSLKADEAAAITDHINSDNPHPNAVSTLDVAGWFLATTAGGI